VIVNKGKDFCTRCRRERSYGLRVKETKKTIRDKEYLFKTTAAYCEECGGEVSLPGLIDLNIREIIEQHRTQGEQPRKPK